MNTLWRERAIKVLVKQWVIIKGIPQTVNTLLGAENTYLEDIENINPEDAKKKNIIIVPWFTCSQRTYTKLWSALNKDNEFNLIKIEGFADRWKAILNASSIEKSAEMLLETIDKIDAESVSLLGHSFGWNIAVYAELLAREKQIASKIAKIVTLSSPLGWSLAISQLPGVNRYYRSLKDMHPDSDIIEAIRKAWRVDHRFVTLFDEIFPRSEMAFHKWDEHLLEHWHFQYMTWKKKIIQATADEINKVMLTKTG